MGGCVLQPAAVSDSPPPGLVTSGGDSPESEEYFASGMTPWQEIKDILL